MTIKEAIQLVCDAFGSWESEYCYLDDWAREHEARDLAVYALETWGEEAFGKMKEEKKTRWIPISEERPEKDGEYLVTKIYRTWNGNVHYIVDAASFYLGVFRADPDKVVAWMPLPKPYNPREKEE